MSVEDRKREEMELLLSSPKDNGGEAVQSWSGGVDRTGSATGNGWRHIAGGWGRAQVRADDPTKPAEFNPGFFFCFCGARRVLDRTFQTDAFGRDRCNRTGKFSGPSLLEPSWKVKRNYAHNQSSAFVVAPVKVSTRVIA
jgi:hypothetical protein